MTNINQQLTEAYKTHQSGNLEDAVSIYERIVSESPEHANAWVYLGIARFDQRRFADSITAYQNAIRLQSHFPIAWNNCGNSHRMLGQIEQAESCFETSLDQDPNYLSALKNRGTLWIWSGEIERGMQWYERGLEVEPHHAELHRNLGVIELLRGNLNRGFDEYRWRWRMPGLSRPSPLGRPWKGEPLQGKSILLYPEQGLGDAIQFVRVAKRLSDAGARVSIKCPKKLINLFSSTTQTLGVDRLIVDDSVSPTSTYHASFIEALDWIYQNEKELPHLGDLITPGKGYLYVSDALVEYWRSYLNRELGTQENASAQKMRVGINWQGNPEHHADVYRSAPLPSFAALAKRDDVQLVSLQFGEGAEQLKNCNFAQRIHTLPSDIDQDGGAFTDTAAILASLDAVITTDTSIAHLSGAMGVRTHVLLGKVPDWRWEMSRLTSPWYPTMTLHRQSNFGRWAELVEAIDLNSP